MRDRCIEGTGFANRTGEKPSPEATCWAILSLQARGEGAELIEKARRWLAQEQGQDGRVCIDLQHADACWPTPLAILAWYGVSEFDEPRLQAIRFLADLMPGSAADDAHQGSIIRPDDTIKGWPWVVGTSAWVEPTAYALLALRVGGYATRGRTADAVRWLRDRQLPGGGWNYGNTVAYGQELRPMPETTGLSLAALAGLVSPDTVAKSLVWLRSCWVHLNTPMSLAWAILGLRTWHEALEQAPEQILRVLARQQERGPYDTVSLSLLVLAWHGKAGLVSLFEPADSREVK